MDLEDTTPVYYPWFLLIRMGRNPAGRPPRRARSAHGEYGAMRTLIVDDEPYSCETLLRLCEADESLDEVEVAECGTAAIEMIRSRRPDLLLLDVELSDMSGFDVLRSLKLAGRPQVIMVAAHEEHAMEALRVGAIDYLMKPVSADRFATAIERVRESRKSAFTPAMCHDSAAATQGLNSTQNTRRRSSTRLVGENSHRLYFIAAHEVDYIEAYGNYVLIHVGDQQYVRRDTLKRLACELHDEEFEWIRRSTLINLARVAFAEKLGNGALAFTLTSGTRLVSRSGVQLRVMHRRRPVNYM
jgi:two-component system, LytTR family, response regulator